MKHADDVGVNDRPRHGKFNGISCEIFRLGDSCIVDKDVELGELFADAGRKRIDSSRIFKVELQTVYVGAGSGDLVEKRLTAAGNDHLIAAW